MVIKREKICIDCRMIEHSGLGTYLKNLVPRLVMKASDITFFLLGDEKKILKYVDESMDNFKTIHMNAPIFSIKEQLELVKKIPQDIDLMWTPHFNVSIFYPKRYLVTIHDVFHLAMPQYVGGYHKYLYAKFLFWMAKRKTEKILTVSNFTKNEIIKFMDVEEKKILPIYLGVDNLWFNIKKNDKLPNSKPFLLFVGNVKVHKNLLTFLQAFNKVKNEIPHDLIIVGKRDGLRTPDNKLNYEYEKSKDRINFTGFIEDDLLHQYYMYADAFVFPSKYEGFGLPLLEAMACGCPVISSNAASLTEVGGNAVIYFDPYSTDDLAEKIKLVIGNSNLRQKMISRGYEQAKSFQWDICAEKTLKIIRSLIE